MDTNEKIELIYEILDLSGKLGPQWDLYTDNLSRKEAEDFNQGLFRDYLERMRSYIRRHLMELDRKLLKEE